MDKQKHIIDKPIVHLLVTYPSIHIWITNTIETQVNSAKTSPNQCYLKRAIRENVLKEKRLFDPLRVSRT